ncbi:unnamed protein product [Schistosoma mattheei]|uniref:Uncharacterized protein n=1 Tax=Schistosoma mattheei TaxID=31246 RepID=A0A183P137_9TREM|nr:unnamed protein product [Schistosoma mattheei]
MKLKLKKHWTTGETALKSFSTAFLRDTDKLNESKIAFNNRSQALQDLLKDVTMENNWEGIQEVLTSTCQEVLGRKKHHDEEWISMGTLDKIQERKNKKTAISSRTRTENVGAQAECTQANEQVKRSIIADKEKYMEDLATTERKAAREGNLKQSRS